MKKGGVSLLSCASQHVEYYIATGFVKELTLSSENAFCSEPLCLRSEAFANQGSTVFIFTFLPIPPSLA